MQWTDRAVTYFSDGFNCSQSVCAAFAEALGVDRDTALKFSAGFGGGMGRQGNTCGVVTGAYMALGLKYGFTQATQEVKAAMYDKIRDFSERFRAKHPEGLTCRELLGYDISIHEEHVKAQQAGLFKTICPQLVRDASEILEEMLAL